MRKTTLQIACISAIASSLMAELPNVILIMSDDQGIGDFGVMGNPHGSSSSRSDNS